MVHILVLVGFVHFFSMVPSFAADRSSAGKSRAVGSRTQIVSPAQFQRALLNSLNHQFSAPGIALSVDVLHPKRPVTVPKGAIDIQVPP